MAGYVLVRSNWSSVNSISLDFVCDVDVEDRTPSTTMDKQEEDQELIQSRKSTSSDENVTNVTLRSNEGDKRDDPVVLLTVLQPDEYRIVSIQLLSNAKHVEFYHQEYIGSCPGSRVTELNNDSIYESIYEFNQSHEELTLKCLKLADVTDLLIYCLQITLSRTTTSPSSIHLPFDLNRVRSMIDETNLSSNARQFMNDLQHIEEQRRSKESTSQPFNLGQMMLMMKGMQTSSSNPNDALPTSNKVQPFLNEDAKCTCTQDSNKMKEELNALENRLQIYIDKRFLQLQEHIDERFNGLDEKLTTSTR